MNVSVFLQSSYINRYQKTARSPFMNQQPANGNTKAGSSLFYQSNILGRGEDVQEGSNAQVSSSLSQEMQGLLRDLQRSREQQENTFSAMPQSKVNDIFGTSGTSDEKEEKVKKPSKYNYREVSMKVRQAKNTISAGQALLAAKRKVLEVRRQLAKGDGDEEELQLALTHAKQIEMAARKKKHHLELEELVETVQKRDEASEEKEDRMKEASSELQSTMSQMAQDEVAKQEDQVFEKRQELMDSLEEQMEESRSQLSDEMLEGLNELIAEFGEEELKALEEEMEMLESLEVLNPHMSEEELEELKQKHRSAENKAMVKADMDYLKGMIKHGQEKGVAIPGFGSGGGSLTMPMFSVSVADFGGSQPNIEVSTVDIQI